ncbi:hypothetical protein, conserved, partial [Eimeria maxima]
QQLTVILYPPEGDKDIKAAAAARIKQWIEQHKQQQQQQQQHKQQQQQQKEGEETVSPFCCFSEQQQLQKLLATACCPVVQQELQQQQQQLQQMEKDRQQLLLTDGLDCIRRVSACQDGELPLEVIEKEKVHRENCLILCLLPLTKNREVAESEMCIICNNLLPTEGGAEGCLWLDVESLE